MYFKITKNYFWNNFKYQKISQVRTQSPHVPHFVSRNTHFM